jgi:restriction system protein
MEKTMSQPPPQNMQSQNIPTAHHANATFRGQSTFMAAAAVLTAGAAKNTTLSVSGIIIPERSLIIPERRTAEGILIKSTSLVWNELARVLGNDWTVAYQLPPEKLEELVAGAYKNAGYDDVTLTPRSADHGRDVIAIKKGVGSIKILGSVKRYAQGRVVGYDAILALGVLDGERDASKGIITTTSDFPPRVNEHPTIGPALPTRLELMNGEALQKWLQELAANDKAK